MVSISSRFSASQFSLSSAISAQSRDPRILYTPADDGSVLTQPKGTPNTLADLLSLHLPLLFPAPGPGAGPTLAYALLQGVVTPAEAELAWLGACMSGADGWVNICIGLGRER